MLTAAALVLTAFVAGVTGAWSPCGLSMVETLGSATERIGLRAVRVSAATFALGALAGGAFTFTALAALGHLLDARGDGLALAAAVAIALLAALGEALGVRVVPQIRRQVPEPWRRVMPLPLASGLYGILLGLGFTTFVLTLAVWALAGISVAIGSPLAGLLIGLGFGAGRALPVVVLAPRYATLGERLETRMALEPALLRRLRLADAALLAVLALALLSTGSALAASRHVVADNATDPAIADTQLAWMQNGHAIVREGDVVTDDGPAQNIALGGPFLALRTGDHIAVSARDGGAAVAAVDAPGATQIAVSRRWLAWRVARPGGGDQLFAASLPALADARLVTSVKRTARISRPSLAGDRLAFAVDTQTSSRIVIADLAHGTHRVVRRSMLTQLSQPALHADRLLYVEASYCSQRLRLARLGSGAQQPRTLLRIGTTALRDEGHDPSLTTQGSEPSKCPPGTPGRTDSVLWTTALGPGVAYVTLLRPTASGQVGTTVLRVHA